MWALQVEQEEEFLINNLQKRLTKLNAEKADLEKQLESEQVHTRPACQCPALLVAPAEPPAPRAGVHRGQPPEEGARLLLLMA